MVQSGRCLRHRKIGLSWRVDRFQKPFQLAASRWVAQFSQGFGFDLANALAGDVVLFADFLERARVAIHQPVSKLDDSAFPSTEPIEHFAQLAFEKVEAGD